MSFSAATWPSQLGSTVTSVLPNITMQLVVAAGYRLDHRPGLQVS